MRRRRGWGAGLLLAAALALLPGCGGPQETAEQKLTAFQQAHAAIYDAWQATTPEELKQRLSAGMIDPLLSEQIKQQTPVMNQRKMLGEKHVVKAITFNALKIEEDGASEMTVYADWTVDGIRDHGDVHEVKVSYKKRFHAVRKDGKWMLDRMMD